MRIVKTLIAKIKEGVRFIDVRVLGNDAKNPRQISPFGVDSSPYPEIAGVYTSTTIKGQDVILGYQNPNQVSEPGETRLYSSNTDLTASFEIILRTNNTAEIGGAGDNLVRYSPLEALLIEIRDGFNSFVDTYNSHTHAVSNNVAQPTPQQGDNITLTFDGIRIDNIFTSSFS